MNTSERLDATFTALADPTRRAILARLAEGEASVAELAEPFSISQPAISKHLKILERAGLISVGQVAQRRPRRFEPQPLAEASAWLEHYRDMWEVSFERLDALLDELQRKGTDRDRNAAEKEGISGERPRRQSEGIQSRNAGTRGPAEGTRRPTVNARRKKRRESK